MHLQTLLTCDVCGARMEWAAPIVMHGPGYWTPGFERGFGTDGVPRGWSLILRVTQPLTALCSDACREKYGVLERHDTKLSDLS